MAQTLDDLSLDQLQALYAQKTDPNLRAIHSTESASAPATANPVNPSSGARSAMQVMPDTARKPGFGVKPSDGTPVDDVRTGVQYYQKMLTRYGDPTKAAVAYNWGPGNADTWLSKGGKLDDLPLETLKYIQNFQKVAGTSKMPPAAPQGQPVPTAATLSPGETDVTGQNPAGDAAQPAAPAAQPSRSFGQELVRQLGLTARAAGHGVGDAAGALTQGFTRLMGVPDVRDVINNAVDKVTPEPGNGLEQGIQGAASAVANPLNLLAAGAGGPATGLLSGVRSGALTGALSQAMAPTKKDVTPAEMAIDLAKSTALGAAGGGVAGGIGSAIGRVLSPRTDPAVQRLIAEGVQPTPAQALGRAATIVEGQANSVPLTGSSVTAARQRADESLNKAMYARALDGIPNAQVPTEVGRAGVEQVRKQLSDSYDSLLPNLKFRYDSTFINDLTPVNRQVRGLAPNLRADYRRTLTETIGNGRLSGDDLKAAQEKLNDRAQDLLGSNDAYQRRLGKAFQQVGTQLKAAINRQNPKYQGQLDAIDSGWSVYSRLRDAASRVTGGDDVPFTPAQLQAAVRAGDKSVGKGRFATGRMPLSQIADDAMKVMGHRVPDSGTAGRIGLMSLLSGAGFMLHPGLTIGVIGAPGAYSSKAAQKLLLDAITKRPEFARAFGDMLQAGSPAVGGILAPAIVNSGD